MASGARRGRVQPSPASSIVVRENVVTPSQSVISRPMVQFSPNGTISSMITTTLSALLALVRAALMPRASLALENAALRQRLTVYIRTQKRPRLRADDRAFWIALHRLWSDATRSLVIVKPATVVSWHRRGFKAIWRRKSRPGKIGRPRIPRTHIAMSNASTARCARKPWTTSSSSASITSVARWEAGGAARPRRCSA